MWISEKRAFLAALEHEPDLIFSEPDLEDATALELLEELRINRRMQSAFVLILDQLKEDIIVKALKAGADEIVLLERLNRLETATNRALKASEARSTNQDSERHLRLVEAAVRHLNDIILITEASPIDEPGPRIVFVNDAFERNTGYSSAEVLGRSPRFLQGPLSDRKQLQCIREAMEREEPVHVELQNYTKDQKPFWVDIEIAPIFDSQGRCTHFASVQKEITHQKRAEQTLRETRDRFDQLAQNSRTFLWQIDVEGYYTYLSEVVKTVLGYRPEELVGKVRWHELCPEPERDKLLKEVRGIADKKEPFRDLVNCAVAKDGHWVWLSTNGIPIFNEEGHVTGYEGWDTDITEAKNLEMQLLRSQRLESIGTLAGGIAHNLNNALTPVLMSIDMLKLQDRGTGSNELIHSIEKGTRRAIDMVRQILSFAKGIDGDREALQGPDLIHDLARMIRETFPKNIHLELKVEPEPWSAWADSTQIYQVLLNLCVNARDAMPEGGLLQVALQNKLIPSGTSGAVPPGSYLVFTVTDNGIGMSKEIQSQLFVPFFTTKEPGKGTGLGLPSSLGIIKSHGGFMDIASEPGQGSTFSVYLPATTENPVVPPRPHPRPTQAGRGETILLVDDEAAVRRTTQRLLELFGYRVLSATNGKEALDIFSETNERIDLVITDMMMPVMDGPTLIAQLRELEPALPVIVMSGAGSGADHTFSYSNLGCAYLRKPFDSKDLAQTLKKAMAKPA